MPNTIPNDETQIKKTALHSSHLSLNGRMVEFGGWHMPVQYSGLADEHETCRTSVGLFDVSHMGEVRVRGKGALNFLNQLVTNNVSKIKDNQAQYTVMCYENGGCVDDLIIHRFNDEDFFICVNASNTDKDFDWIKSNAPKNLSIENVSSEYSQIAIQGRNAEKTLQKLTSCDLAQINYYWFSRNKVSGVDAIIARTGYTGEDGFEIYIPWSKAPEIWDQLLLAGQDFGIKPCGLGARDTLRTEMKYPLYGHEIDAQLNPLEAGLGWVTKLDKPEDFIGKKALEDIKKFKMKRTLVGLKSLSRAIPRQGYVLEQNEKAIGVVTSGTMSPSLKYGIAIAYVDLAYSKIGNQLDVVIRDQRYPHEIVVTPFYTLPYKGTKK